MVGHTDEHLIRLSLHPVQVAVYNTQGQALGRYCAYEEALGVRSIAWHPTSGRLLAVGSCDKVSAGV